MKTPLTVQGSNVGAFDAIANNLNGLSDSKHLRQTESKGLYTSGKVSLTNFKARFDIGDGRKMQLEKRHEAARSIFEALRQQYGDKIANDMQATYAQTTKVGDKTYLAVTKDLVNTINTQAKAIAQNSREQHAAALRSILSENHQHFAVLDKLLDFEKLADTYMVAANLTPGSELDLAQMKSKDSREVIYAAVNATLYSVMMDKGDPSRALSRTEAVMGSYTHHVLKASKDVEVTLHNFLRSNAPATKVMRPLISAALAPQVKSMAAVLEAVCKKFPDVERNNNGLATLKATAASDGDRAKLERSTRAAVEGLNTGMSALIGTDAASAKERVAAMDPQAVALLRSLAKGAYDMAVNTYKLDAKTGERFAIAVIKDQFALRNMVADLATATNTLDPKAKDSASLVTNLIQSCFNGAKPNDGMPDEVKDAQIAWQKQVGVFVKELLGPVVSPPKPSSDMVQIIDITS